MISDDDTLYEGDFVGITHLSGKVSCPRDFTDCKHTWNHTEHINHKNAPWDTPIYVLCSAKPLHFEIILQIEILIDHEREVPKEQISVKMFEISWHLAKLWAFELNEVRKTKTEKK